MNNELNVILLACAFVAMLGCGYLLAVPRIRSSEHAANHDPLTRLPNRRGAYAHLGRIARRGQDVWIGMLDADQLSAVNNLYGHDSGDLLLCVLAQRLTDVLSRPAFVARLSGDEFLLVVPGHSRPQEVTSMGRQILDALAEPVALLDQDRTTIRPSACIGWAHGPGAERSLLMAHADKAMYVGKPTGGTVTLYDPAIHRVSRRRSSERADDDRSDDGREQR